MHPSSILSYYPSYALLDEALSYGQYKSLNIYMDLKNNLQTLYMKHSIENILENSKGSNFIDTSVFVSILSFLSFHKIFAIKRNININFFLFFERGPSFYHLNIDKKYKVSRKIDDLYGLEKVDRDFFFEIIQRNFSLVEKCCNYIPNVFVIALPNLEADFVPYYLIRNSLVDTSNETCHIVYSNDHDLYQCVKENVFLFSKTMKRERRLIKRGEVITTYLKKESDFPDTFLPVIMSIIGDTGDDVTGIRGIGPSTVVKILNEFIELVGGVENLYENVFNNKPIFSSDPPENLNKIIGKIIEEENANSRISRNIKLVSFELISRALDDPFSIEMLNKRKYIENVVMKKQIASLDSIKKALEMNRIYIYEDFVENLYYGYNGGSNEC